MFGNHGPDTLVTDDNQTTTFGPNLTIRGKSGNIKTGGAGTRYVLEGTLQADVAGGHFDVNLGNAGENSGLMQALNGDVLTVRGTNWTNTGTITEFSSELDFGGSTTTSGLGPLTGGGGSINFTGTLTNDVTLVLDGAAGAPQYFLNGGTIKGGTISTPNGGVLLPRGTSNVLDGVTLAGNLEVGYTLGASITAMNGLTLSNGTVTKEGNGGLIFQGSQTLSGTGTVFFADGTTTGGLTVPAIADILTIGPGVTIDGISGSVGSSGGGTITNNGVIAADGGGKIFVYGLTNFAGGTLTGGTYQVSNSSVLRLIGANITTDAANIVIDGAASHIYSDTGTTSAVANLSVVSSAGALTLLGGASIAGGTFTNNGAVTVGTTSALAVTDYVQNGGTTVLDGGYLGLQPPSDTVLSFDGTNDYVQLPGGSAFADFTTGMTVGVWAYPTANSSWSRFIDLGNGPSNNNIILRGGVPPMTWFSRSSAEA